MKDYRLLILFLVAVLGVEAAFIVDELGHNKTVAQVQTTQTASLATATEVPAETYTPTGLTLGGDQVLSNAEVEAELKPTPLPAPKPKPKSLAGPLDMPVKAWLAVYVGPDGQAQILTTKNADTPYPIASLTKLITAIVAKEQLDPNLVLSVTPDLKILTQESASTTTAWPVRVRDLLAPLLIESNNNAAATLAATLGEKAFVDAMNETARELGMLDTHFVNPHGLDPKPTEGVSPNTATPTALINLLQVYVDSYPDLLAITRETRGSLYSTTGEVVRTFKNTNKLLGATDWPTATVIGGKTGFTDTAGHALALVLETDNGGKIYTVVLDTNNHFMATWELLNWIFYQYRF